MFDTIGNKNTAVINAASQLPLSLGSYGLKFLCFETVAAVLVNQLACNKICLS